MTTPKPENAAQQAADRAFMREARIGLTVVGILFVVFLYVAIGRLGGWHRKVPVQHPQTAQTDSAVPVKTEATGDPPFTVTPKTSGQNNPRTANQKPQPTREVTSGSTQVSQNASPPNDPFNNRVAVVTDSSSADKIGGGSFRPPNRAPRIQSASDLSDISPPTVVPANQFAGSPLRPPAKQRPIPAEAKNIRQTTLAEPQTVPTLAERQDTIDSKNDTYTITKNGESFWSVSQAVYGDGQYFRALYHLNRERTTSFDELRIGTVLETPKIEKLRRDLPEYCPPNGELSSEFRSYPVEQGETLFGIARDQLGQASRYVDLLELNKSTLSADVTSATPLQAGTTLRIPSK